MQWIQANRIRAECDSLAHEASELAEITDAPVLAGTQRVELYRDAPEPIAGAETGRLIATLLSRLSPRILSRKR